MLRGTSSSEGDLLPLEFEVVSKNLTGNPYTLSYSSGVLSSITYTTSSGTIVKTFGYTSGKLTSIVLSGALPANIFATTKTLGYTGDNLTSVSYS